MALKCRCICGCKLLVSSDSAGKRIKCPKCERKLRVPVDLVEKRRAQLESRQASPQTKPHRNPLEKEPRSPLEKEPRSKIEKPLSSLVDLPEPEPPPIQLGPDEPLRPPSRLNEPTMSPDAPAPDVTSPPAPKLETPPPATPAQSESPPKELLDKADSSRKPPPLPIRREDRTNTQHAPVKRQEPPETVDGQVASGTLPAEASPAPQNDSTSMTDDVEEAPPLDVKDVELPVQGYQADRDKVASVRWLAAAILITGLVGTVPAIIDVVEHSLSETSAGLSRWACGLFLVGLLQCAYAMYLVQLPDWSSVWVVTIFTLAIAAGYAAMCGLTLLSSDQGHFVQVLDLADRLRGGKATAWCLIMLSLMSLTSYFSGRVGARWRNAFVA